MQPSFALLTLQAVSVLVAPGPEDGCPSARQVSAALSEHAPAAQSTPGPDSESALTLVLPAPGTPQEPSVSLIDQQGSLRLFRILARPGAVRARDCAALADTVAMIVQRYLEEVELPEVEAARTSPAVRVAPPAPPAPSPPPPPVVAGPPLRARARWDIALGISQRLANQMTGPEAYDLRLSVARTLGARMDTGFLLRVWSGISGWTTYDWTGARGEVIRLPSGLEFMWRRAASSVELQLGLAGLLDFWILGARDQQQNLHWDYRLTAAGALTGGMQVPLGKRLFARLFLDVAVAAARYEYDDPSPGKGTVFSTPRVFGDAGLAVGMSLR
ncbi:MAG TPA: hypothetical protein VJ801_04815 [Polyangia bacterium]|nr:hypothetical protein [Polyangia bacterium]